MCWLLNKKKESQHENASSAYEYRSSSSSSAAAVAVNEPLSSGQLIENPLSPDCWFIYTGSNFLRNWSYLARSVIPTERRAPANASSKCLRPISAVSTSMLLSSPAANSSAAMASRIAALAARWQNSAKSAPLKPSVLAAMKLIGTLGATGDFLKVDSKMP